jgi:predicted TPR repeat methyltransferase
MDQLQTTTDAETLIRRAAVLMGSGRTGAARSLLAAARKLAAPAPDLARLSAQIALQDGTLGEVVAELDAALAAAPNDADLRKLRSELRQRMGDLEGAARDAAEAVIVDPHDPVAKALLGVLMLDLGRVEDATACLREAVQARPDDPTFREALASAQERHGQSDLALATLVDGTKLVPAATNLRNAAILLCIRRRDFSLADSLSEDARIAGVADACTFGLQGHALSSLGRHDDAAEAYASAYRLGPNDPYVRHLASTAGYVAGADRAPEGYLRTVFDGYADRFESHIISLGYRIPGVIRRTLETHPAIQRGEAVGPVLDLGCGTGLVALAISDLPLGPITGIDLSARMLAEAEAKHLYHELCQADIEAELSSDLQAGAGAVAARHDWAVILAADTLCYFGALEALIKAARARLQPGGWLVFSTEELLPHYDGTVPGNGEWALLRQGRYAHSRSYILQCAKAAGFNVLRLDPEIIRIEAGSPVAGFLAVFERSRYDA